MAGVVSLLNHVRLSAGKTSLGFLNPLFYAHPEAFHDITIGYTGWYAAPGWDPLTGALLRRVMIFCYCGRIPLLTSFFAGLGSPKYGVLREIVMALP
jgi:hypothetical protein